MSGQLKIACIGEAMIELAFDGKTPLVSFAGDTLNTAIYLRRHLPSQFSVSFVSVVGCDPFSQQMLDFIEAEGVATDDIVKHPSLLPGLYAINTDSDGERSFLYWRENSAARSLFEGGFAQLEEFDVIYFSAITLAILPAAIREGFLAWLKDCSKTIIFDSNYRPKLWPDVATARSAVEAAWRLTDVGLPSVDDEMDLYGEQSEQDVMSRLTGWGVHQGALKRGSLGPRDMDPDSSTVATFEKAKSVVDTTAAGDSFNGGFIGSYLQDRDATRAMMSGHNCSVAVIGQKGAIIPADLG